MEWDAVLKLLVSGLLSGVIGLERESVNRPAGFRTHVLVGVGATLVMIVSTAMPGLTGGADPGRIAAQVVSGIGFLGAGTILREGGSVRGLTTAASLWVVSAIGLAVGFGLYFEAAFATLLVVLTLTALGQFERKIKGKRLSTLAVLLDDKPGQIGKVTTALGGRYVDIKSIEMEETDSEEKIMVILSVRVPPGLNMTDVSHDLMAVSGVHAVEQR